MSSIPLPALHLNPPPPQENPIEGFSRILALKNQMAMQPLQMQAAQQNVQSGALDLKQKQIQAKDAEVMQGVMQQWAKPAANAATASSASGAPAATSGPDYDSLLDMARKSGASFSAYQGLQKSILDMKDKASTIVKNDAQAGSANANAMQTKNNMLIASMSGIAQLPDEQLAPALMSTAQELAAKGILDPQHVQMAQQLAQSGDPAAIRKQLTAQIAGMGGFNKLLEDAQKKVQTQMEQGKSDPTSPFYAPSEQSVAMGTAPGAAQIQRGQIGFAAAKAGAEEKARMPGEMALAAQRQALSQGDPKMAGHLLTSGQATLSELKARGSTPDFIAKSLYAAHQEDPSFNAIAAEAQFNVAKSQANTGFFGSAGSLVSKGGTLDQLQEAAKAIPQNQIPVFNTIEDAMKAATGDGPIAKYASLAVGASDDYSKVMGGGTGSDTSRAQAFKLLGMNQSPAARGGSIEGIRGAVGSQMESRIGANPTMQRMYGSQLPAKTAPSGLSVTAPNGKVYSFKDQASADAFKQKAGIQ
jgi:hypothetical protein